MEQRHPMGPTPHVSHKLRDWKRVLSEDIYGVWFPVTTNMAPHTTIRASKRAVDLVRVQALIYILYTSAYRPYSNVNTGENLRILCVFDDD